TGVAGPGGGTAQKPVGLVHIAVMRMGGSPLHERCTFGKRARSEIREMTVARAFEMLSALA
ncbi:MAG: damage-inducible protein CinA, partial [Alphaproteobacteria bacterium]